MKYLEQFKEQASAAFNWTSFDPHKRGGRMIADYEECLVDDLKQLEKATEEEKLKYIEGYKAKFSNWLSAKSRCASSMITGPANFPIERNRKANNKERTVGEDFDNYRTVWLKRIKKNIQNRRPEAEKHQEEWGGLENQILRSAATIINIDLGLERGCSRALFVNSIVGKVEKYVTNGNVVMIKRATELITNLNDQNKKPIISSRHKFWKFLERAENNKSAKEDNQNKEDKEYLFEGFKVVLCYKNERLRIVHDEKPEREVIDKIKSHGFKWSRFNIAWQRKLTQNAFYVTFKLLFKDEKQLNS